MAKEPKSSGKQKPQAPPAPSEPCHSESPPASLRTFRSRIDMGPVGMKESIKSHLKFTLARDPVTATPQDWYQAAAFVPPTRPAGCTRASRTSPATVRRWRSTF